MKKTTHIKFIYDKLILILCFCLSQAIMKSYLKKIFPQNRYAVQEYITIINISFLINYK